MFECVLNTPLHLLLTKHTELKNSVIYMVSVFPVSYNQLNEVVSIRKFCNIFQPFHSQELVLLL